MAEKKSELKKISKGKKVLFSFISLLFAIFLFLIISEILLRLIPIPGIRYDANTYDSLTGGRYHPNSMNYYRNDKVGLVKRKTNNWGYYDKNHTKEKKEGTIRIGFFGDSFTQAIQVPLEETFHYLIGDSLKKINIETLSFGVSGFSTFQAYLTCNKWADFFDLDIVVYVFFENDIGDQIEVVNKSPNIPYPILINNQIIVDNSFRELGREKLKFYYRFFDYLSANFLVFATISERRKLLMTHGIKVTVDEKDRFMTSSPKDTTSKIYPPLLDAGVPPPLWPDSLRTLATDLEKTILVKWKDQMDDENRLFVILYTPKGIKTPANETNSWKPWLMNFCLQNNIPFIDPTEKLVITQQKGFDVFYDHYTKYGHKAVSDEFINWFLTNYKK